MKASVAASVILLLGACQSISKRDSDLPLENPDASSYFQAQSAAWSARRAVRPPIRWHSDGLACWIGGAVDRSFGLDGVVLEMKPPDSPSRSSRRAPSRGRQLDASTSPDNVWKAVSRNGNILLEGVDSERRQVVTVEGTGVLKYGTASWVYGEELDVQEAMWWRGDSQGLVYYRFDESGVPTYPLTLDMTSTRPTLSTEAYPKPGDPNPVADLEYFDLETGERWLLPTQPAQADGDPWYIFGVTPHREHEFLFHRTDRRQQTWELVWVDLSTRDSRVVLSETQSCWHENNPQRRFLSDGTRFLHQTQQSGWLGWVLCSLDPEIKPIALTPPGLVAGDIVHLDESTHCLRFLGANQPALPLHQQLFEVQLDGSGLNCLTPEPGHHVISHAPLGTAFVATHQSVEMAPEIRLHASGGDVHILHPRSSFDAR
ncbi:MAG: DPP IV N-terminal domain-containing protein, partial [Planctomycetota bacterium]